jgi:metal-responsive CopG/Arc/MetJ family transcriptional regulator
MADTQSVRSELVVVRMPVALAEQLDVMARREFTTRSEYLRQALLAQLRADAPDGVRP